MTETKQTKPMSKAQIVRTELKKQLGATGRQISVTGDHNSVDVRIKAEGFNFDKVSKIAHKVESIDRCAYSGEILSGGNTYVSVSVDWEFAKAFGEKIQNECLPVFEEIQTYKNNSGNEFEVYGVKFLLMKDDVGNLTVSALDSEGQINYMKRKFHVGYSGIKGFAESVGGFIMSEKF